MSGMSGMSGMCEMHAQGRALSMGKRRRSRSSLCGSALCFKCPGLQVDGTLFADKFLSPLILHRLLRAFTCLHTPSREHFRAHLCPASLPGLLTLAA